MNVLAAGGADHRSGGVNGVPPPGLKATADLLRKLGATETTPVKAAPAAPKNP
jgi:hypothetical protein